VIDVARYERCVLLCSKHSPWVQLNVVGVVLVTVNSLCCVVVGLVVWYEYSPTSLTVNDRDKYAIVGALQLWMMLFAVAAVLFTEVRCRPTTTGLSIG